MDNHHGKTLQAIADWRVRWATVAVTLALSAFAFAAGYGSLKRSVDDGIGRAASLEYKVNEHEATIAKVRTDVTGLSRRLDDHVALPVHIQTSEALGRLDERVKGLEATLRSMNDKLDRLLLQGNRSR